MQHDPIPILFTSWYVGLGGGETALLALVRQLDPDRFRPHLVIPYDGQLAERWRDNGWTVHILPFRGATTYFVPLVWSLLPFTRKLQALIREHRIRAVHSDYHTLPFAVPAAQRTGVPLVWTCWGWWFRPKLWQRGFFKQPDATFFPSRAIRDGFLGEPPFMSTATTWLLPPGVDTDRFRPGVDGSSVRRDADIGDDTPLVALVARFQDVKGHHIFQEMARLVVAQMPEARFLVAGEDIHNVSAEADYKRRILETHNNDALLREHVTYLGFRDDTERVMAAADVVVCSSFFESYGMVNVEAMASGTPVVSTNRGGPSETVVDGETGFLVEPGDAAALAEGVLRLLRDADLRASMSAAGRRRVVAQFSAQSTAQTFTETTFHLMQQRT